MSLLTAHLVCVALVGADLVARALRIQWYLQGLGYRVRFRDAFTLNAFGDAGCTLSPMRVAGEPLRLAGMLRAGVPATAAFVAIAIEVIAAWPVIILTAAVIAWRYVPAWWVHAWPALRHTAATAWPWLAGVAVATVVAGWLAARAVRAAGHRVRRPLKRIAVYWRRMPAWPIAASVPCTLVNVLARTALLPVLAMTLPSPPPLGAMMVGSFGLLYSQLILPTPAGLGAVDLGVLAGAAGDLGSGRTALLLAWRFYSVGAGALLGGWLAARIYGWRLLREVLGRV